MAKIVGGGAKKVLYTLNTVRRMGLVNSAKALRSKNACKACGLGMGGQQGGMTNEAGEFPSVCNKSVQAQSTDVQPAIPSEFFDHSLDEIRELTPKELEHAGRLGTPVFKAAGESRYRELSWDEAMDLAAQRMAASDPERAFFYSSGRSSNESGFVLQLLARLWGTNNVNNCSFYCHQATGVGLGSTIGTGTSTVELEDLNGCDLIFVIGANPASNHPRFIHKLIACRERGGEVIVINPAKEPGLVRFAAPKSARSMITGGTEVASDYLQPNIGGDLALFKGIAKAVLEAGAEDRAFLQSHCEAWEAFLKDIEVTSWEQISDGSGLARADIERVAAIYARSKNAVFAWGMGMTHHRHGSENVEYIANLALLRGMLGRPYAGLLPLRGHSNVQGIGTIGVKPVLADAVFESIERELGVSLPRTPGFDTLAALEAAEKGAIDVACIVGGNLYAATPDSVWAARAMDRIGLRIHLTTTLNQGHLYGTAGDVLILPVAARDEEHQSTTQESMFNYVRLSDGGIHRLAGVRSEVAILTDLGQRLMPDSPVEFGRFSDHEKVRETIAKTIPGMQELQDIGVAKKEFHVRDRLMHTPRFQTPSGKAQFRVHPLPVANDAASSYPFLLASIRSEGQFNSIIYEETDSYRYNAPRWSVLLSPDDMRTMNLAEGDRVDVVSAQGSMRGLKIQPFDLPPGNVLAYYPEANVLTDRQRDPRSQTPRFKSTPVRLQRSEAFAGDAQ
ncbi:MAG: molybdopterin-dependent oxidoreductase alpha subunit [Glaciecola sp.]|uniref:FdhF/YdeP family oxidoreductase n=1 Tax=Congregibacter sp. TaxID=2744308 RepID=UPI0039E4D631